MVCDPKKYGAVKKRLRSGQCRKAGAVIWQWVPTFKEAVPPSPSHSPPPYLTHPWPATPGSTNVGRPSPPPHALIDNKTWPGSIWGEGAWRVWDGDERKGGGAILA